ncbi:MAG: DUF4255 domain-containing protein [Planctomycetes bacterium]|nr:DUF4255 domain-containing protein [Planctomycetota bacterium]
MINEAVEYVRREVRDHLGVPDQDVFIGDIHALKADNKKRGIYISLVNLEEENTLKNTSHVIRQNDRAHYKQPPVHLNLYLLFAFNFEKYDVSLLRLSETIELFQSKPVLSSETATAGNPFPTTLEKLIFDFHDLNLEQLSYLWGILGGAYLPSALYKVRMIRVQADTAAAAPEITSIRVDTGPR